MNNVVVSFKMGWFSHQLGNFGIDDMNCSYQFTIHSGMKPLELTLVRRSAEQVQWLQALGNSRGKNLAVEMLDKCTHVS